MLSFTRIFTSFILSIFGFFLTSPIFALGTESGDTIILSSSFSDICNSSIQCEKLLDGQYICHVTPEILSNQGGSLHQVPIGKSITDILLYHTGAYHTIGENIRKKPITYIGPDPYLYPFVGIIKIQV